MTAAVTTGATPTANKAVVAAELRRAIERQARRRGGRGQDGTMPGVLLLQAAPEWVDDPELRVTGFEDDRAEAATVAACPTVLAVLDALASHHGTERYLVILTSCDDEELGGSVLAQAIGNRVYTINRWDLVLDAFGARRRGPGVSGKEKPWLAGALLDAQPPGGWGKVSGPILTLDLVMSRLVGVRFGISDGRDEATMDAAALLEWTRNELRVSEFLQLRREERDGLADWLRDSVGSVARVVFGMLESAEAADVIPVGLALRGLTEPDAWRRRALATAMVRAEERFFGGHPPAKADLRAFAEAAESLISRWSDGPYALQAGDLCVRAQHILAELGAADLAAASPVLDAGFETRLASLADVIARVLPDPRPIDLRAAEAALDLVLNHVRAVAHPAECAAAEAALSAARWLAGDEPLPGTLAEGAMRMLRDWAWADRALAVVSQASTGGMPKLAVAYAALCKAVGQRRSRLDQGFAQKLAAWTETSGSTDDLLLVENVLDRIARPVAERGAPLLLVLDGMSAAVGCQLAADIIVGKRWVEVGRREDGREPVLATVPSITSISRTSLLSGALRSGGQGEERAGFSAFWRPRATHLFHKGDLRAEPGSRLSSVVRDALHESGAVVAVVLNTVDDTLDHGREGDEPEWRVEHVKYLSELLDEAARAGRPVILTSDHGHIRDQGLAIHDERSPSARYRAGTPGPGEISVRGPRVLAADGEIVAAWDERIRYAPRKDGYHGGAAPSEVVVPAFIFVPPELPLPRSWHVLSPGWHAPPWWNSVLPGSITAEAADPAEEVLFQMNEVISVSPSGDSLGSQVTGSELFATQRRLARRAPAPGQIARLIDRLAEAGGKVPVVVAADAVGEPPFRMAGYLAQVARLLNVDGYRVIGTADQDRTVELNIALLQQQFLADEP